MALVTARMPLPSAYGRVVRDGERVARIIEAKDASGDELTLDEMNAGLYAFDEAKLRRTIAELRPDNAQGEYDLTDTIGALVRAGDRVLPVDAGDYRSVLGVNDRSELAAAATALRRRLCEHHMPAGVTITDPATTYLEPDLELAADVTVLPNTSIGGRSRVGAHSEIGPNARLRNARIGEHVVVTESIVVDSALGDFTLVGPWAHVRGNSTNRHGRPHRQLRRSKEVSVRARRQGSTPHVYRRCEHRRTFQHRRRHDHVQLRRHAEASHDDRQRRVLRLELLARRAARDRRACLHGSRHGRHS